MSTLGRKSIISHEQRLTEHKVHHKVKSDENYSCIVLDVVGTHKPKSRFVDEVFDFGIWFIVASYELEEIFPVCWSDSYDALRFVLGTDENITGRRCFVTARSSRKDDLRSGKINFLETRRNAYQDEQVNNYYSTGGLYGVVGNYETMFKSYSSNEKQGPGESWSRIK